MEYTLEQKALAAIRGDLWWRMLNPAHAADANWSLVHEDVVGIELNDLQKPGFVYHIGPKAPQILSELEAELVSVIESFIALYEGGGAVAPTLFAARAAIKKARGEA